MLSIRTIDRSRRALARLLTLGYFLLSAVLPFQHTHFHGGVTGLPASAGASRQTANAQRTPTTLVAQSRNGGPTSCAACEWEAMNVSPALPVLVWHFEKPLAPRVITTFPRYLRVAAVSTSSRAPPIA